MRVDLFDFELPDDRIALRPVSPRDSAKLLVVKPGEAFADRVASDLPRLLEPGDALVFNDTRVIPAQLEGTRERDGAIARIGATLHMRTAPDRWKAFVRGAKKLRDGDRVLVQCGRDNLRRGDVLVFQVNGRLVIHRLIDIHQTLTAQRFVTCGDNVRRADAPVHVNQIVGPVIAVERGERVFKLTRLHWHLLGRSLAWLQRLFLKLRRRLE